MDAKYRNDTFFRTLGLLVIITVIFSGTGLVYAANAAPFVGHWETTDYDGSQNQLIIAGPPNGPFHITGRESYISYCGGGPGIVQGTGWLNNNDPYLLETNLHLECFTTGAALDFQASFRYHPATNKLSSNWVGLVYVFSKTGPPQTPTQLLELRVNYGHDWVEGFYEAGHIAWIVVTEENGLTVKAFSEMITETKDYWDWEPGFQTMDSVWFDRDGNEMDYPPDIEPNDWVYGWVDNGATSKVQIGEINGVIDFENDAISGKINAPWFSKEVVVECFPWGAPDQQEMKYDSAYPNSEDEYSCSWAGEWEINLGQDVGVGYIGPDGHWVANAFFSKARIIASESGDWFWTTDFTPDEPVYVTIYPSNDPGEEPLWTGSDVANQDGFINFGYDDHGIDLVPGSYLVISGANALKGLVMEPIFIDLFDTLNDTMAGTAPTDSKVLAAAGLWAWQEGFEVTADGETNQPGMGAWFADFQTLDPPFDITEDMRTWSWAQIQDEDGDANEGSTPPKPEIRAWLGTNRVEGYQWQVGSEISLYINDFENPIDTQTAIETEWGTLVNFNLNSGVLEPGQDIWMIGGGTEKFHTILPVSITNVDLDANFVEGSASENGRIIFCLYDGGCDPPAELEADGSGYWSISYGESPDIYPGSGMDATEFDDDGDGTSYDYWVPEIPYIEAFAWFNRYSLVNWPKDIPIEVTIANPDFEGELFTPDGSSNWYDFEPGIDLIPGSVITATNGEITKELIISPLSGEANTEEGTVEGLATPSTTFFMRIDGDYFQSPIEQTISTDSNGSWWVDFEGSAPLEWFTRGEMWERDQDGDVTYAIWHVRNRVLEIWLAQNEMRAFDWPPDTELTFYVYDPETDMTYEYPMTTQVVNWMESTWAVETAGDLRLHPGMSVSVGVSGGNPETSVEIQDIKINLVDTNSDQVSGYAPPGANLELRSWEDNPIFRFFSAENDGSWIVDYTTPSINDVTVDVSFGDIFSLFMREPDKDSTVWDIRVPWFVLQANTEWVNTNISVMQDKMITIEAEGLVSTIENGDSSGPDGQFWYMGCGVPSEAPPPCALDYAPYGALIAKVGESGVPFFVGSYYTFTPLSSGELWLTVNDNLGFYDDNTGEYKIYLFE